MLAFKGFTKDLTCIRGEGIFRYEPGVLYTADKSKCARTGFHCTENPLECLDWYALGRGNRYHIVEAGGSIDEDGKDAKISCTQIRLVEELSIPALVYHALVYMVKHPLRDWEKTGRMLEVRRDVAQADKKGAIAIARGECPKVCGSVGAILGLVVERDGQIKTTKLFIIPGPGEKRKGKAVWGKPDTWYTLDENRQLKEVY